MISYAYFAVDLQKITTAFNKLENLILEMNKYASVKVVKQHLHLEPGAEHAGPRQPIPEAWTICAGSCFAGKADET